MPRSRHFSPAVVDVVECWASVTLLLAGSVTSEFVLAACEGKQGYGLRETFSPRGTTLLASFCISITSNAKAIVKNAIDFSHQIIFEPFLSAFIRTGQFESHLFVSPQGVWWMTAVFLILTVHCAIISPLTHTGNSYLLYNIHRAHTHRNIRI